MTGSLDYSKLSTCSRIVIDGDLGAEKTVSGKKLAEDLGIKLISLDCFLNGDRSIPYWDQIKYDSLQGAISASPKVIIEGVCALKVLAKIGVRPDYHIFKKRLAGAIGWEVGGFLPQSVKPPRSALWREIIQYYREYKPFEICDCTLYHEA